MSCSELKRMRSKAAEIRKHLEQQRREARRHTSKPRGHQASGRSDYEPLLERRLMRLAHDIERHISHHQCQK